MKDEIKQTHMSISSVIDNCSTIFVCFIIALAQVIHFIIRKPRSDSMIVKK